MGAGGSRGARGFPVVGVPSEATLVRQWFTGMTCPVRPDGVGGIRGKGIVGIGRSDGTSGYHQARMLDQPVELDEAIGYT